MRRICWASKFEFNLNLKSAPPSVSLSAGILRSMGGFKFPRYGRMKRTRGDLNISRGAALIFPGAAGQQSERRSAARVKSLRQLSFSARCPHAATIFFSVGSHTGVFPLWRAWQRAATRRFQMCAGAWRCNVPRRYPDEPPAAKSAVWNPANRQRYSAIRRSDIIGPNIPGLG